MRRLTVAAALLLAWALPAAAAGSAMPRPGSGALPGFRLVDATAASVNGEIIFLSDVDREACFERCEAFPGESPDNLSLSEARRRLIHDRLVLQEQRKLSLGSYDNDALAAAVAATRSRMAGCSYPCAIGIEEQEIRTAIAERLLVAGFLEQRVAAFTEVPDEEVQREIGRRAAAERKDPGEYSEDAVRAGLRREKAKLEARSWYYKTASGARIFLSPLEEP